MKSFVSLSAAILMSATFAVCPPRVVAQTSAETSALISEFKGQVAASTRTAAQWQADYSRVLESLLPDMGSDDLGKRGAAQDTWEKIVLRASRPNAATERNAISQAMLPKIAASSPREARIWLLKMLEWIGREEAVPQLTALLGDADSEIAERARRALTNNPAPSAGVALRAALNKTTDATRRVAFVSALGFRREAAGTALLGKMAADSNALVAEQAIVSLAQIGDAPALKVLSGLKVGAKLQPVLNDARMRVAAKAVSSGRGTEAAPIYLAMLQPSANRAQRMGALRGLVQVRGTGAMPQIITALSGPDERMRAAAARLTLLMKGANATKSLSTALPKLPAAGQIALLGALADRGDSGAQSAVVALTQSTLEDVRIAAWRALGAVGNPTQVNRLAKAASGDGAQANAARDSLARLQGAEVDNALLKAFGKSNDAKVRVQLIRALSARRSVSSLPFFLTATGDGDASIRAEAISAVGNVGDMSAVPTVLAWMQKTRDNSEIEAATKAVRAILDRSAKTDGSAAPLLALLNDARTGAAQRAATFRLLGAVGTSQAFDAVNAATKSSNAETADAAIRALADWSDDRALSALIDIAKVATPTQQVLALRGVSRLIGPSGRPANEKVDLLRAGLTTATRGEEKRLMIGSLSEIKTLESLSALAPALEDEVLREDAAAAIVKIAKELKDQPLKDARPTLDEVVKAAKNADTVRDAKAAIARAA